MFKILIQENPHVSLILLDQKTNSIKDKIDFSFWGLPDMVKFWKSSPQNKNPIKFLSQANSQAWVATGDEKIISKMWFEKARPMAQRIDDANIKVSGVRAINEFNCRTGVMLCLNAMGLAYIPPATTRSTNGTACDVSKYGLSI